MSEPGESSISMRSAGAPPAPPAQESGRDAREVAPRATGLDGAASARGFSWPLDPRRLVWAFKRRWHGIAVFSGALALVGAFLGFWRANYYVSVTLISRGTSTGMAAGLEGESFKPQPLSVQTLVSLMQSSELLRRVGSKARPPVSQQQLLAALLVSPEPKTELVKLSLGGKRKAELVGLANLYANEAVQLTRELQLNEPGAMSAFYKDKLEATDQELQQAGAALTAFQKQTGLIDPDTEAQNSLKQLSEVMSKLDNARIEAELAGLQAVALESELLRQNPPNETLQTAKAKLASLLTRYTEAYPEVQNQRREIANLEGEMAAAGTNAPWPGKLADNSLAGTLYLRLVELKARQSTLNTELRELEIVKSSLQEKTTGTSEHGLRYALLKARLDSLQKSRGLLASRHWEAQWYADTAQGYYRLFAPATLKDVDISGRWLKAWWLGLICLTLGIGSASAFVMGVELADGRLKTSADVERVTGLPVLASLGDLNRMTPSEKEQWAFRTWTILSGKLSASTDQGLVCGFISSTPGEGRSTWIELLLQAAFRRGSRVLAVAARPSFPESQAAGPEAGQSAESFDAAMRQALAAMSTALSEDTALAALVAPAAAAPASQAHEGSGFPSGLSCDLKSPSSAPGSLPVARIPLPGWVWNPARRRQWQAALARWQSIPNLVLLLELPPATIPEAVLLAENLPQLIWLVDSAKASARETRLQLDTLRHAKCRLAGAVLNHEPASLFQL